MCRVFVHCLLGLTLALALCVGDAPEAAADEIFELENGVVLKGYVMREEGDELTIRLTGLTRTNTVTIHRDRIRNRYAADLPLSSTSRIVPRVHTARDTHGEVIQTSYRPPELDDDLDEVLPRDEPEIQEETFLERFARLTRVALPDSTHARATIGLLLAIVLMVLISGGARLADADDVSFFSIVALAAMLGGFLFADLLHYEQLLRADRALWVMPAQALAWIAAARVLLGGSIGRAVMVFAFTLVSLATVVFATGAVFVAV